MPIKTYGSKVQTGASTSSYNVVTLNKNFNAITDTTSNVNANYHAVTVEMQKSQNNFFSFDVNYTWSHALDFNQNTATAATTNNWFDPYANARANYGNSTLNIPHRVVGWALINIPGRGGNEIVKQLTTGWSLKPLVQVQSGLQYSATVSGTTPNQCSTVGCLQANSTGLSGTGVSYIPLIGRNSFRQPMVLVVDARVEKDFPIREKYNLQIFAEAFNLPNHDNITGLSTGAYSSSPVTGTTPATTSSNLVFQPSFQSVTSQNSNYAYNTRLIQLAARFVF